MTQDLSGTARPAQAAAVTPGKGVSDRFAGTAVNAPVAVVTQAVSTDVNPRARAWIYITEILQRAGLFFEQLSPEDLPSLLRRARPIVLLAGDLRLTSEQRQALAALVRNGGSLIGIGGTSGLDEVFGVSGQSPLAEGWMKVTARDHPVTAGLRSSLHVFGGSVVKTGSATALAELEAGNQAAKGSAIVENRCGQGRAVLLAPDLMFSIVHIQQGLPVLQDGKPAPDGSAAINEGVSESRGRAGARLAAGPQSDAARRRARVPRAGQRRIAGDHPAQCFPPRPATRHRAAGALVLAARPRGRRAHFARHGWKRSGQGGGLVGGDEPLPREIHLVHAVSRRLPPGILPPAARSKASKSRCTTTP